MVLSGQCKNFFEKFCQIDYLMVPCISAMVPARHVLLDCISRVGYAKHFPRISPVSSNLHLGHADRLARLSPVHRRWSN